MLGSRLVLFQCPASFTPTAEHLRDFTGFFERLERDGLQPVWEPRSSYSDADLAELKTRVGPGPAYVLFNNTAMWDDARRFRRLLT